MKETVRTTTLKMLQHQKIQPTKIQAHGKKHLSRITIQNRMDQKLLLWTSRFRKRKFLPVFLSTLIHLHFVRHSTVNRIVCTIWMFSNMN